MGKLKVALRRVCARKPRKRRARRGAAPGAVGSGVADADAGSSDDSDGSSNDSLGFEDTYEADSAWKEKDSSAVPSKFTSMNPLAMAAAADPRAARKIAQRAAGGDVTAPHLNPALSHMLIRDQEAIAELSAQQMQATTKAATKATAKEEAPRPAPAALLVTRAYAGKAAKH